MPHLQGSSCTHKGLTRSVNGVTKCIDCVMKGECESISTNSQDGSHSEKDVSKSEFKECDTCKSKPGSPVLCDGCLHNREVIRSKGSDWKTDFYNNSVFRSGGFYPFRRTVEEFIEKLLLTQRKELGEKIEKKRKIGDKGLPFENSPELYGNQRLEAYKKGFNDALSNVLTLLNNDK